jgi:hypothetical protein
MPKVGALSTLTRLAEPQGGVFRGKDAQREGVTRERLGSLVRQHVIERVHPDVYRVCAVATSSRQRLLAALLWAGDAAAAAGRSAGELYRLDGVKADTPEIVLPHEVRGRRSGITVYHGDTRALMIRTVDGIRVTGVEATLMRLASVLDAEQFEIACEDARHRADPRAPRAARPRAPGQLAAGGHDRSPPGRARRRRLRPRVPARVERAHVPL